MSIFKFIAPQYFERHVYKSCQSRVQSGDPFLIETGLRTMSMLVYSSGLGNIVLAPHPMATEGLWPVT